MAAKILFFSKYGRKGASSRVRTLQYLPLLESYGYVCHVQPLFNDKCLSYRYKGDVRWVGLLLLSIIRRIGCLVTLSRYDVIWIEKELFPFFPGVFEKVLNWSGIKYVVDYDDAIFHRYDLSPKWLVRKAFKKKIDKIMRRAATVVVGNGYLAQRARRAGASDVRIIPSSINLDIYRVDRDKRGRRLRIGWIGSPSSSRYLCLVTEAAKRLLKDYDVEFVAVGADPKVASSAGFRAIEWCEDIEVELISSFDIGIMPLEDTPWERGKCGYKLIQYLGCGVPVVASPVGVNVDIAEGAGLLAVGPDDWFESMLVLINNESLRKRFGDAGVEKVRSHYSVQTNIHNILDVICSVRSRH